MPLQSMPLPSNLPIRLPLDTLLSLTHVNQLPLDTLLSLTHINQLPLDTLFFLTHLLPRARGSEGRKQWSVGGWPAFV